MTNRATTDTKDVDWDGVPEAMVRQIFQQAETYLQAQLQIAIASDARAMTLAGFLVALATALVAASLAYWDKSNSLPVLVGGLAGAAPMVAGAFFAVWAARPLDFYLPGNEPEKWFSVRQENLSEVIGGEAQNYGDHIACNKALIEANASSLILATKCAVAAPVIGAAAWAVTYFF